jgi:predicted metalloprotease with PDZ domain
MAPVHIGGATIHFSLAPFTHVASETDIKAFVLRSAEPVAAYYGHFPVKKLKVEVMENDRGTGLFGREFHGNRVQFFLGSKATAEQMRESGILTHEMFHLGFPDLVRDYAWIEEGLATYLAHLARARSGQSTETEFWNDAKDGFEDSLPKNGDAGLADAEYYRRIYWGGALFWFEIDLEIREHTHGAKSLDTVTRGILKEGGDNAHPWKLPRLRHAVDAFAGFPVFQKWYAFFGMKPGRADLPALWAKLGLTPKKGKLEPTLPSELRSALLKNIAK